MFDERERRRRAASELDAMWDGRVWSDRVERETGGGPFEPSRGRTVLRWMVVAVLVGLVGLVSVTSRPLPPDLPSHTD